MFSIIRLQWKAKEHHKAIESELADRDKLLEEVTQTIDWLEEAKANVTTVPASTSQVEDVLEGHAEVGKQLEEKMTAVRRVIDQHKERYADESEMPPDLKEEVGR